VVNVVVVGLVVVVVVVVVVVGGRVVVVVVVVVRGAPEVHPIRVGPSATSSYQTVLASLP